MSIDVPALDDRSFQQIVDEAKRKIPEHFPEWTNHNVSDPGVALIELFAWMTEMTLFRLNKLPDKATKALLGMVGFEVFPARAATADLTFFINRPPVPQGQSGTSPAPVPIRKGTRVATDGVESTQVIFETDHDLLLTQPVLEHCGSLRPGGRFVDRWSAGDDGPTASVRFDPPLVCFEGLAAARRGWSVEYDRLTADQKLHWKPRHGFEGDALYFGFASTLARALVRVAVQANMKGVGIDPQRPPIVWEASTKDGWARCRTTEDRTQGLNVHGTVDIQFPADHDVMSIGGGEAQCWLRLRFDEEVCPTYEASPELISVDFETVGGVVSASHAEFQTPRMLGWSDGKPGQTFQLERPVVRAADTIRLTVDDEPWQLVDDFRNADESARVFTLDASSGEIAFGPEVTAADGVTRAKRGAVPKVHARIVAGEFRIGGGDRGNVGAGRLRNLRDALSYVASVTNFEAAQGGVDAEPIESAIERAPLTLRAGDRAVTLADYERIVRDAAPKLPLVVCRPPLTQASPIRMLILPPVATHHAVQKLDDYTLPDALCDRIASHLESRRLVGTTFLLTTPFFLGLSVAVRIRAAKAADDAENRETSSPLRDRVLDRLYRFINPIIGGERGDGLGFDEAMTSDRIANVISDVNGVRDVIDVVLFEADARRERRLDGGRQRMELPPDTLFMSFQHRVIIEEEG